MNLLNRAKANYILEFPDGSKRLGDTESNLNTVQIQKKQAPVGGLRFPRNLDFSFESNDNNQFDTYRLLTFIWYAYFLFR